MNQKHIELIKNQAIAPTNIKQVKKVINKEILESSLFTTTEYGQRFIYKISDSKTAMHNLLLSQILAKNNIPVPDSKIFVSENTYFEKYKAIPGVTASLVIANDLLNHQDILEILQKILALDKQISDIKLNDTTLASELVLCNRRKNHHVKTYGKFFANIYYQINKKQTMSGNVSLHHFDLNPSNILLDENNNIRALLDLDSITICNEYPMLLQILSFWPNISVDEIAEIYKKTFNRDINIKHLKHLVRLRKIKKHIANQILKVKTKTK